MSDNRTEEWAGDERRGIPIHLLNLIDARMESHVTKIESQLDGVRKDVHELTKSIGSWMDKQAANCQLCTDNVIEQCEKIVDEAIPVSPYNEDATPREKRKEHRKAHASLIDKVQEEMESWAKIRQRVKEWAIIGALGLIGMAVWKYLLLGPK